jgi:uncharacterized protein with HEPN domain
MSRDEPLLFAATQGRGFAATLGPGIVDAIDQAQFFAGALHQNAVIRSLEALGKAAAGVSKQFREDHPEISWRETIGMRNRLIHAYANVSPDAVWDVPQNELPGLTGILKPFVPTGDNPGTN